MKNVYVIGAGQLGSRHLQALKAVSQPLNITVIDPNTDCLKTAQERYETFVASAIGHSISYCTEIPAAKDRVELAIIPTSANVRKRVVEELLSKHEVKYMVLEKLLFQHQQDFHTVSELLKKHDTKAWVNCSMRTMPFYQSIRNEFINKKIIYHVSGSQFGLVTNAIHYIDHMAHITGCLEYSVDTTLLDETIIPSKRNGFLELNGTLSVKFANGSQGIFTCYPAGDAPIQVQISNSESRVIVRETERKAWISQAKNNWQWIEVDAMIPYQSEMTTAFTESLLNSGTCDLVSYEDSLKIHLQLLEPLLDFTNKHLDNKYDLYPFT